MFRRLRLVVALILFGSWLAYLGYAVANKGKVQIVSRAQLTAATVLVIGQVATSPDGTPTTKLTIDKVLQGTLAESSIEVMNLPAAATPIAIGESRTPAAGLYCVPLVKLASGRWMIAGLPRSPGVEAVMPVRPTIYPWTDDVQQQLRTLGLLQP
ncbi:MAG: hypothetical protein ACRCZF_22795, partial [Gemmataceae bacterium]